MLVTKLSNFFPQFLSALVSMYNKSKLAGSVIVTLKRCEFISSLEIFFLILYLIKSLISFYIL